MPQLTSRDYALLDKFIGLVLDRYKAGERTKTEAVGDIAHVVAAVDKGVGIGDDPRAYMKAVMNETD
ncbi:hypothetical protein [Mesorhizobium sp. WSM4887]|uniref:hypothetical protein n=1 Tax=Mesorhizobium sp. WSM4887 TaxID=3038543 RepID=UPI00241748E1|nr:hypothetical protein [Mesorhizobium sp. WSM4887]MDG4887302.1 hypothetical protein [Mesorhizobium sp. WSM4887]